MDSTCFRIIYINLDNEKKRMDYMEEQFSKYGIVNKERFSGLYGKNINIETIQELVHNNLIVNNKRWCHFKYNKAILAIYVSHIKIWKHIYEKYNSDLYTLILEDDVILPSDLYSQVLNNIKNVPDDWDIIFIGRSRKLNGVNVNENVLKPNPGDWPGTNHGMFAYLIKTSSIQKLLKVLTPINYKIRHIDWVVRSFYNTSINAYYLINPIVKHDYEIISIKDER